MAVEIGLGQIQVAERAEIGFIWAAVGGVEVEGLGEVICAANVT